MASADDQPFTGMGCCCMCVESGSVGVVQSFGKYSGYTEPGFSSFCIPLHSIQSVSVAVKQMECITTCKTKDNVTLSIKTAVQFKIDKTRIRQAVFEVENPESQIIAAVDNVVRSGVPSLELDDVYSNKDSLRLTIIQDVTKKMDSFGYLIMNALVTDIAPDRQVLMSMNQINASARLREAAIEQGEAQKVLLVKSAEAESDARFLSGQGQARMRVAMATGFKESMEAMSSGGLSPQEAMQMMVTTQYLDALNDFSKNPTKTAIMVPVSGPKDLESQMRDGMLTAEQLNTSR